MTAVVPHRTSLPSAPTNELTARERDVIAGVARGLTNRQICDELYLTINSVKTYIRLAYRKIGVTRRPQAVIWALENGFPATLDGGELFQTLSEAPVIPLPRRADG